MKGFVKIKVEPEVVKAIQAAITLAEDEVNTVKKGGYKSVFEKAPNWWKKDVHHMAEIKRLNSIPYVLCWNGMFRVEVYAATDKLRNVVELCIISDEISLGEELATSYNAFKGVMK